MFYQLNKNIMEFHRFIIFLQLFKFVIYSFITHLKEKFYTEHHSDTQL